MKSSVQTLSTQCVFNKASLPPGIWENPRGISNAQASPGPWGQRGHGLGIIEHFRWGALENSGSQNWLSPTSTPCEQARQQSPEEVSGTAGFYPSVKR